METARPQPGQPRLCIGNHRVTTAHLRPATPIDVQRQEPAHLYGGRIKITAASQHSKTDYNLYEGTEVVGTPEVVLLRGTLLVENGELAASPGIGRYVARARFGEELAGTGRPVAA